jgi:farnesyl diphosphate synthase
MASDVIVTEATAQNPVGAALREAATQVEDALDRLLPTEFGPEGRLAAAMRYATLGGGKRLRGFLVMETAALFAVAPACAARVAASVEMLHAYSLVHDDLPAMDDDDLRRGRPSCHIAFDEATAILAGDALQARAFEVLAEPDTHSDPLTRCELVAALGAAAGARGMAGGQMIDMLAPTLHARGQALTAAEVTRLQALKTGRLIQYSAEAGAILGRAAPSVREHIAAYGRDLGAAFQIADDLLDAEGTTEETGKTAGKDAAAGKATLVAILGREAARVHAVLLAEQAAAHLDRFDSRADRLRQLAAYVVARRN